MLSVSRPSGISGYQLAWQMFLSHDKSLPPAGTLRTKKRMQVHVEKIAPLYAIIVLLIVFMSGAATLCGRKKYA